MNFQSKLQELRKNSKISQEELAEQIGISRQAVTKWENGQAYPDIDNLIRLSEIFGVTIDRMVKDEGNCVLELIPKNVGCMKSLREFLLKAKKHCYPAKAAECSPSRLASHDIQFQEDDYLYLDTYLGGECFAGEEAVWEKELPKWSMNYSGRILNEGFSGDFLKEALLLVPKEMPYRGPGFYQNGDYSYHCKVDGDFEWYQGYEEIYYGRNKVYECYFHGGVIR
jgi:Predicted transcriptional regulators